MKHKKTEERKEEGELPFFQWEEKSESLYRHIGLRIDLSHEGTVEKLIVEEGTRSLGTIIGQVDVHFEMRKVE